MRYYDSSHPMLKHGDPARGEWKPWESRKASPKADLSKRNQRRNVGVPGTTPTRRA